MVFWKLSLINSMISIYVNAIFAFCSISRFYNQFQFKFEIWIERFRCIVQSNDQKFFLIKTFYIICCLWGSWMLTIRLNSINSIQRAVHWGEILWLWLQRLVFLINKRHITNRFMSIFNRNDVLGGLFLEAVNLTND